MKNPQTIESVATLGVAALLTSEICARINTGTGETKTIAGTPLSEGLRHNLAQTVFRKELMSQNNQPA